MNKILILLFFLLTLSVNLFSQYSLPLRLVNSDGSPNTGEAANISFTRYPHSHPTDVVSGITITEIGTAGNYRCRGFTTYEYVKLWLSGVEQTWFDSVQVGSITSYLSSNYISKTTTQTGISGTKVLTGDWTWTAGNITLNKPYIYGSSPWASDYSLLTGTSLVFKNAADSLYVLRDWIFLNSTKLTLQSGITLWGLGNTAPFSYNSNHFNWSTTGGLELDYPVQYDSVTIRQDTIISEGTYYKYWTAKRHHWSEVDSLRLWWVYRNTLTNTSDSFQVINEAQLLHEKSYVKTVDSISISPLDTFSFPQVGLWQVTISFEYEFEYVTPNNSGYDSLFLGVYEGDTYTDDFIKDRVSYKVAFNSGVPFGLRSRGQFVFRQSVTSGTLGNTYYLAGMTSGICHSAGGSAKTWIRRTKVELLKVR